MQKPFIVILIWLLTGCTEYLMDFTSSGTGFVLKSVSFEGQSRKYCLYVPDSYSDTAEWPLIIFFHGSGERGLDGKKQCTVGIGPAINARPDYFPCLVLLPQESRKEELPWREAFDQTVKDYRIDENRIYVTGLSVGGTYTWIAGAEYPDRFAALMPLCGKGKPDD
jgi:predicted peptidase